MTKISPLAPANFPAMPVVRGVRLAVAECGIKYKNRNDVMVAELAEGTNVAGVFTKSKTASYNIIWGRKILPHGKARILLVNSGNSNAFNGIAGEKSVERIVKQCAALWGCREDEIYPCATGVIGVPLPDHLITNSIADIKASLKDDLWQEAAGAIMTTDTFPKGVTKTVKIGGTEVVINGFAKGSGMIAPDMATMLSYIFTDASIASDVLQKCLNDLTEKSFNSITVDSDTSTSDTCLLFATGQAGNKMITDINDADFKDFYNALQELMVELAHLIVKDGEGATKFVTIKVTGAEDDRAAKVIGLAIANSPLVKTAIAGEDANWGRIIMAVGKAGEVADRDKITIVIGGMTIVMNGQLNPGYNEEVVTKHMRGRNVIVEVAVGVGNGSWTVWTCDLTHDYITINADYRS